MSTTALLSAAFYPERTPGKGHLRLRSLELGGYLRAKTSQDKSLWTLTKRGFLAIRERLPELQEDGFQSETPGHDLLVTAVHLGPSLTPGARTPEFCTEQELRRYARHSIPDWVPRSSGRRPDGYWQVSTENGPQTIALEVELSRKSLDDYLSIAAFYESQRNIALVIWLVPSSAVAERIQAHLSGRPGASAKHCFVSIPMFVEHGWKATIERGPCVGTSLEGLLRYEAVTGPLPVTERLHLTVSKSPHRSKRCLTYEVGDSFN